MSHQSEFTMSLLTSNWMLWNTWNWQEGLFYSLFPAQRGRESEGDSWESSLLKARIQLWTSSAEVIESDFRIAVHIYVHPFYCREKTNKPQTKHFVMPERGTSLDLAPWGHCWIPGFSQSMCRHVPAFGISGARCLALLTPQCFVFSWSSTVVRLAAFLMRLASCLLEQRCMRQQWCVEEGFKWEAEYYTWRVASALTVIVALEYLKHKTH